jgi:hypothetical protein
MELDVSTLLALPAAERLALAEMLRRSVGYPADIEILLLPAWQRVHLDRLLEKYTGDR